MEAMYEEDMKNSTEIVLAEGRTGIQKPVSPDRQDHDRPAAAGAGRFLSGMIGLGSTLTASFSHRRLLQPGESLVVLAGGSGLVVLGLIAILLPHLIAWLVAMVAIWPGIGLLLHAARLWRLDRRERLVARGDGG